MVSDDAALSGGITSWEGLRTERTCGIVGAFGAQKESGTPDHRRDFQGADGEAQSQSIQASSSK